MAEPAAIAQMRERIRDHEVYTDQELANVLYFGTSLDVVFAMAPPQMVGMQRLWYITNVILPGLLSRLVDNGAINPIHLSTVVEEMKAEITGKKPEGFGPLN